MDVVRREEKVWSLAGESPAREIVIAPGRVETAVRATKRLKLSTERAVQQLREFAGRNNSERH